MTKMFGGGSHGSPTPPPPVPTLNQAIAQREADNSALMARGRMTTVMTGDNGLPDLGTSSAPVATAGGGIAAALTKAAGTAAGRRTN